MKNTVSIFVCLVGVLVAQVKAEDLCKINPCKNYGICKVDDKKQAKCLCLKEYTGPFCETKLVKTEVETVSPACQKCKNGAACSLMANGSPNCTCKPEYTGTYCEIQKSPCLPNPCQNNGFCVNDFANVTYICVCSAEFTGRRCETRNVCGATADQNPCKNNGYCINLGKSYLCKCPDEFFGNECEKRNPCVDKPCSPNGICIGNIVDETFNCICSPGYSGKTCDEPDPCSLNPCKNDGICRTYKTSLVTSFKCICMDPFTGPYCETKIDKCVDVFESCSKLDTLCPIIGLVCRKTCNKCDENEGEAAEDGESVVHTTSLVEDDFH